MILLKRYSWPFRAFPRGACLFAFLVTVSSQIALGQIALPVEVVGPSGYIESRHVILSDSISIISADSLDTSFRVTPADIDAIWMQGNNMGYRLSKDAKGSIRINDGEWIDISNRTALCDYPDNLYDCVWGSRSTIKFRIVVTGFVAGRNKIEWRFNKSDGNTSGFRIMGFNLLAESVPVLADEAFVLDDPDAWAFDPAKVADGKRLFDEGAITMNDLDATISAAQCVDCHQNGGSDLKRLAFSDKSIIARSVFHGMSVEDGEAIAAYVRSDKAPVVGRPWSPVYQPGPGLDAGTADEWFAGAGLEWVLDDDLDALPYLLDEFERIGPELTKGDLNMRELPQAFQFPDWNEWLPAIAMQDIDPNYDTSDFNICFTQTLPELMATDPTIQVIARQFELCLEKKLEIPESGDRATDANRILSARQFRAIEALDFLFENKLFDACEEAYPKVTADPRAHGERRCTLGVQSLTFNLAPHRIFGNDNDYPYVRENNGVLSSAWYRIAVVLNSGHRYASEQNVIDWKYQQPHISNATWAQKKHPQFVYYLASYTKLIQQADKDLCNAFADPGLSPAAASLYRRTKVNVGQCPLGIADDADYNWGWNWRGANISDTAILPINRFGFYAPSSQRGYPTIEQARSVIEPIVAAHCSVTSQHDPDDWQRAPGELALSPSDTIAEPFRGRGYFVMAQENATQLYRLIPMWRELGVSDSALQCWADWAEKAWPLNDYQKLTRRE